MSVVLLVEDDSALIEMYRIVFSKEKMDISIAVDGEDALQKIKTLHPEIVLLDIMMPKVNGMQVLQEIKSNPDLKNIRVFMLTNLYDQQIEETAMKAGAEKFIIKSQYLPQEVVNIVTDALNDFPPQASKE